MFYSIIIFTALIYVKLKIWRFLTSQIIDKPESISPKSNPRPKSLNHKSQVQIWNVNKIYFISHFPKGRLRHGHVCSMLPLVNANSGHREPCAETNARVGKFAAQKCYRCQRFSCSLICTKESCDYKSHMYIHNRIMIQSISIDVRLRLSFKTKYSWNWAWQLSQLGNVGESNNCQFPMFKV